MRIVIDMQGAQSTGSRLRGIGRYTMAFAQTVVRNRGEHEVILALSGLFPDTIEPIRAAFDGLLPQENIRVWYAPGPVREHQPENNTRRKAAELIREAFLTSLQPDIIHICSLFEGYSDDAVTSIGRFDKDTPVSVTLHDLIPLLNPEQYLKPYPDFARHYMRKLAYLKRASLYLSVSESSRQEAISALGIPPNKVINTSEGVDERFKPVTIEEAQRKHLQEKFGINRPFVLFSGATDERKNVPRLIEAYARLPLKLRQEYQLVLAGNMPVEHTLRFNSIAKANKLHPDEFILTGYVTDQELIWLYNLCSLYVFPSWHEGFGLPALEAMACGAPVIGANTSSLPEVIGLEEALFNPFSVESISQKMVQALTDEDFRNVLREHGLKQSKTFSWEKTARRAIDAWETFLARKDDSTYYSKQSSSYNRLIDALAIHCQNAEESYLIELASCLAKNEIN
jgi:glycosyltransferase involved in cell wall biosynthesis